VTTAPTPDLRALSNAVKAWACCNEAWPHAEHFDVAVVGGITEGEQYPLAQIEADTYGTDGESLKLAQFYAAANPGAVLALLDRIAELEVRLVAEARAAAEQKLRADQLAQQHRMQAQMHAQATQQLAELEARKPLPLSDDDRLRLRSDVARAIWDVMREHEDRCDHALEDVDHKHQVWDCADAAIETALGIIPRPNPLIASREVVADGPVRVTRLHLTEEGRAGLTSKAAGPLPGITGGSS